MDFNDYWQENKRFLVTVASGALVFVIGSMLVGKFFGDELNRQRSAAASADRKIRGDPMYTSSELATAQDENQALQAAVDVLVKSTAFQPRPNFVLDQKRGSPSNQYFAVVSAVREDLLKLAGRANLRVPSDLGLPALSPTREPDITRYLEALDLVDRGVRMAIASGCERVDKIEIRLDPKLTSREGTGHVEKTRVAFYLSGKPAPMVEFLSLTQQPGALDAAGVPLGSPLLIEKSEMNPARTGTDALLEMTFVVARLAVSEPAATTRPE